ncbi:MAG TPA: hypothetical protein VN950_21410 [Terriglobales bacterium]|nr:hypothetical protein [Terriglobales bacterium]
MTTESYEIPIGGKWTLEDLYIFPRAYEQCYFIYLALSPSTRNFDDDRIIHAYEAFPWQGGYSAVNFYNQLKWAVPRRRRPQITRIRYASPGIIELGGLVVSVAIVIEKVVRTLCDTAKDASHTYSAIYRDMQKRRLLRIKTENEIRRLTPSEFRIIESHNRDMGAILDVDVDALNEKTGSSYKTLKILLSLFRRARSLASFQKKGKLRLK